MHPHTQKSDIYYSHKDFDTLKLLTKIFGPNLDKVAQQYRGGQLKKKLDKYSSPEQRAEYQKAIKLLDKMTSPDGRLLSQHELTEDIELIRILMLAGK